MVHLYRNKPIVYHHKVKKGHKRSTKGIKVEQVVEGWRARRRGKYTVSIYSPTKDLLTDVSIDVEHYVKEKKFAENR